MRWLKNAWLIIGVSLGLLAAVELVCRLSDLPARSLGMAPVAAAGAADPCLDWDWWPAFLLAREQNYRPAHTRFDPFRGWWTREFHSAHLNVDAQGRRVTVHSSKPEESTGTILFLGGSTIWGYTAPDSLTIPTLVEAELHRRGLDVTAVNMAQISFVFAQGVATLLTELRDGRRPLAVVSLDGVNDAGILRRGLRAGDIHHQHELEDMTAEKSTARMLVDMGSRLHVAQKLLSWMTVPRSLIPDDVAKECEEVADKYCNLVEVVEALAREFGFHPLLLWQPSLATAMKPLTEWESQAASSDTTSGIMRSCSHAVDVRMARRPSTAFHSLVGCFRDEVDTMLLDEYGHLTIKGNHVMAVAIADLIEPELRRGR